MADLTLVQRFGSNVNYNEANQEITIKLGDLRDSPDGDFSTGYGLNISAITTANIDSYASKILWALLMLSWQNQAEDNNDETVNLYMINQGKRGVNRNSVAQFGYSLVATAYQNDSLGTILDPDNIGA